MAEYSMDDFVTVYPGIYEHGEAPFMEAYLAECRAIDERGDIDVQAMIEGRLPADTPGYVNAFQVPEALVKYQNDRIDPDNKLLNDPEVAKAFGYKDIFGMLTFTQHSNVDKAFPPAGRDTILANQLNGNITAYLPIYPGDTLYEVVNHREIRDITPDTGSKRRYLAITGECSMYNQNGEKVNDQVWNICEGIRIFKEDRRPMDRKDMGFIDSWEGPAWLDRTAHYYTDADWDFIVKTWEAEDPQGETPLYWDDVKIGDKTRTTIDGPIYTGPQPHESSGHGKGGSKNLKQFMLGCDYKNEMDRDPENGIYRPKDMAAFIPRFPKLDENDVTDERGENFSEAEIHAKNGDREVLMNYVGRDIAVRHLNNWMGYCGWIKTISWEIMTQDLMVMFGKDVPKAPYIKNYIKKVPAMCNKVLDAHPLSDDIAMVKGVVTDKYILNDEPLVEITWWIETIDHFIYCDGLAVIKLPRKEA